MVEILSNQINGVDMCLNKEGYRYIKNTKIVKYIRTYQLTKLIKLCLAF